jgi:hypothetical protein
MATPASTPALTQARSPSPPGKLVIPGPATAPPSEDTCRAAARALQQERPGWLILWGCYTTAYIAFPLFTTRRRGVLVISYSSAGLLLALDEAERLYRLPSP